MVDSFVHCGENCRTVLESSARHHKFNIDQVTVTIGATTFFLSDTRRRRKYNKFYIALFSELSKHCALQKTFSYIKISTLSFKKNVHEKQQYTMKINVPENLTLYQGRYEHKK